MKTLRRTMAMMMMLFSMMSMNAARMTYYEMRDHARFLTDRMVYVLNLRPALVDELYLINYDYICGVNDYLDDIALGYRYDDYNTILLSRDYALRLLLGDVAWRLLTGYDYFYRPIAFVEHRWHFTVYVHDRWGGRLFFDRPVHYLDYRGGHYYGGMAVGCGVCCRTEYYDTRSGYVNRRSMDSYERHYANSNRNRGASNSDNRNYSRNDNMNNRGGGNHNDNRNSFSNSRNDNRSDFNSRSDNRSDFGSRSDSRSDYGSRTDSRSGYNSRSDSRTNYASANTSRSSERGYSSDRGSSRSNVSSGSNRSSGSNNTFSTRTSGTSRGGGRR